MNIKKALLSFGLLLALLTIGACNDTYQKVLKSSDFELKHKKAKEYYNAGEYYKAIPLFEELMRVYKGTKNVEKLYYFYSYSHYGQRDYLLSAHYFNNFASTYPKSIYAEDAQYMAARSYYKLSPKPSLEQTYTNRAIESFQLFINTYPNSERVAQCNKLIDGARAKMESKAFESAELYLKIGHYNAAATALENLLKKFPDTKNSEKIRFLILKSYHQLAQNSVYKKKEERYNNAVEAYFNFIDRHPKSKEVREAERIYESCLENLKKIQV